MYWIQKMFLFSFLKDVSLYIPLETKIIIKNYTYIIKIIFNGLFLFNLVIIRQWKYPQSQSILQFWNSQCDLHEKQFSELSHNFIVISGEDWLDNSVP